MKPKSGFTLTELMVVIAIIAIIMSISIPNLIRWRSVHQLNRATREVHSNIQRMRLEAIKGNTFSRITFNAPAANQYRTQVLNWADNTTRTIIRNLPPGITFTNVTVPGSRLEYSPRGLPNGGVGSVELSNPIGESLQVIVNFTGNARIGN
jgi:prepilin-type N-terminal cleavage/methylation domain-containing protein